MTNVLCSCTMWPTHLACSGLQDWVGWQYEPHFMLIFFWVSWVALLNSSVLTFLQKYAPHVQFMVPGVEYFESPLRIFFFFFFLNCCGRLLPKMWRAFILGYLFGKPWSDCFQVRCYNCPYLVLPMIYRHGNIEILKVKGIVHPDIKFLSLCTHP